MKKRIKLSNGDIIDIRIDDAYCGSSISIQKGYFEEGKIAKLFNLSRWDDYGFKAYLFNHEQAETDNYVTFNINIDDPLFFCFQRFLNDKNQIIIDTDEISGENIKTITIKRKEDNSIELIFDDKLKQKNSNEKFYIFIKNIGVDYRSKIDCNGYDTKERLYHFFIDVRERLLEEFHQMTIDEYLITKKLLKEIR